VNNNKDESDRRMTSDDFPELADEYQATRRGLGFPLGIAALEVAALSAGMPAPEHIDPPFKSIRKKPSSKRRAKAKAARKQNRHRRAGR